MAGHSKFKNIMHRKKAVDAKRSNAFSKHARLIMTAARTGGGDPGMNLSLRYAIDRARADNMPKDPIERAVAKGVGGGDGVDMASITYEGYGPGGVAILVETLTDNRNRTVGEVRNTLDNNGGNMGESGSVAWNFERKAMFFVGAGADREEAVMAAAMEGDAEDCQAVDGGFEISADPTAFGTVTEALDAAGLTAEKSEILSLPKTTVALDDVDQIRSLVRLLGLLDELDDVQGTATNLEWTDQTLEVAEQA
ncbi:MAG: YebC/PmpR family DNA-binding transcriptional regulator [Planctomycetota bacterium]|nr:MAG: YebC/PmpR family DNA-binding transcriptional regulator [Planctomycetota bacterium]